MCNVRLAVGAKKIVHTNARVQPGEKVVVVTDYAMTHLAEPVAVAAAAEVVTCIMPPRHRHGQEPLGRDVRV